MWGEFLTADWNPVDQILPKQVKCTGLDFFCNEKVQSRKSKNDFPFPPVCKIGGLLANTLWHLEKKKYFMAMDPGQILPRKKENSPRQYPWAGSRIFSAAFRQNIAAKILRDGRLTRYCGCRGFLQSRVGAIENKWFQIVPFQTANHPWDPQAIKMQQYFSKMFLLKGLLKKT